MEKHGPLGPTFVLKVNLQCCKACPRIVKKELKKVNGVTYIHIDREEGLVTVSGVADASMLIEAIKKGGRKAKLCKFEMHPKSKCKYMKGKDHADHSDTCSCCDVDVGDHGDLHAPPQHFNVNYGALGSNVTVPDYNHHHHPQIAMRGGGNAGYSLRPALPLYPHANARPDHHKYQYAPPVVVYGRPPPPPLPNNCYHQQCPSPSYPRGHNFGDTHEVLDNNLVHTFSDLNVKGCNIM